MTDTEILDGIREVARAHLAHEGDIALDTPLVDAFQLDSVRMLTLVAEVENHFEIFLEEGDETGIVRVGDLVAVIRHRLETK